MKVIPAIDIIGGKVVRLRQGRYDKKIDYEISPVEAAKKWENSGAELIHVVDLDGAREGRPRNLSTAIKIARSVKVPVEAGGGFRTQADIREGLDKGISRVVVGSGAFEDFAFAKLCADKFREKIIFSVDVKTSGIALHGWEETMDMDLFVLLDKFRDMPGAGEIIYTDIKKDGTLTGPDIEGLKNILSRTRLKIILAGGVKELDHIKQLKRLERLGLSGVIVGRALYEGTINLEEAIRAGKTDNTVS